MAYNRRVLPLLLGALCLQSISLGQTTLRDALDALFFEFPRIKASLAESQISEEEVTLARSQLFPQIGLSARGGEERFRNPASDYSLAKMGGLSFNASQRLYDGGSARSRIDEAKALTHLRQSEVETLRQTLALELSQSYVDILKYRTLVVFAEESVRIHQNALDKTTRKFNAGAGPRADRELVKARLAMAEATLEARHRQLSYALNVYRKFTGLEPDRLEEPEFPEWALPYSIEEVDLARNPRIQSARIELGAIESRIRGAKSAFIPQFDLFVQTNSIDSARYVDQQEDSSALIVMSYDLFGGGRRKAELQRARITAEKAAYQLDDTQSEVKTDFINAWNDLVIAEERLDQLEAYRDAMESVVTAYQSQFDLGQRPLITVLDVENELFSAKSFVAEERYNRLQSAYRILSTTGTLLETLY